MIEAVQLLDTSALHARCRTGGAGRAGYDPDMMLTLLFYAYARGIRSSRQIERLCWDDVAFRVICAQDVPDHSTIWRFADMAPDVVERLFAEVLRLCAKAGMVRLDTITLDGTKVVANASLNANRSEEQVRAELERRAHAAVAQHLATDAQENALFGVDVCGDEMPADLADPRERGPRLERALADLVREREAEQAERAAQADEHLHRLREGNPARGRVPNDAQVAAAELRLERAIAVQQARIDEWERRNAEKIAATGKGMFASARPVPVEEHPAVMQAHTSLAKALARQAERDKKQEQQPPAVRNTTDPDSRIMPTRSGFIQGYNAQNVVTEDLFILATDVTQETSDVEQWVPMMDQAQAAEDLVTTVRSEQAQAAGESCSCPPNRDDDEDPPPPGGQSAATDKPACPVHPNGIGIAVGDAGYLSRRNLTAPGPDRLIATGKRRDVEKAARTPAPDFPPARPDDEEDEPDPIEAMADRLRTTKAMAVYRQRGHIAETPHGHIKHNMGIRAFARRGLRRARAEWKLICAVYNLDRLQQTLRTTGKHLPGVA